jgi:hypothetical protein
LPTAEKLINHRSLALSGKTLEEIAAVFGDTNVVRPPTEVAVNEYDDDKKMGEFSHYDRTDKV